MKKTYFKFYNMLPEPIRSWAKENWDATFSGMFKKPISLYDSINYGFDWDNNKQCSDFWFYVAEFVDSRNLLALCKKKFPELFKPAKTSHRIKLKIVKRKDGSWMFSPVGGNGEKLNDRFANKSNAVRAAKAFKIQMANATIIDEKGRKIEFDL